MYTAPVATPSTRAPAAWQWDDRDRKRHPAR